MMGQIKTLLLRTIMETAHGLLRDEPARNDESNQDVVWGCTCD